MTGFVDRLMQRVACFAVPEVVIGVVLILAWVLPIVAFDAVIGVVMFALPLLVLYLAAVESGKSPPAVVVSVWYAVAVLFAYLVVFNAPDPFLLFPCGVSVLALHETIRLAHTRRRQAKVDPSIYVAAATGLGVSAGIGLTGSALAISIMSTDEGRSWLWVPAAVGVVLLIGLLLTVIPSSRASDTSRNRWVPGERVPPQPVSIEELP